MIEVFSVVGALLVVALVVSRTAFPKTVVRATDPPFFDSLEAEVERARRFDLWLAVVAIQPGNAQADGIVQSIRPHLRSIDVVTLRSGGVALILPGTDRVAAHTAVERLRANGLLEGAMAPTTVVFPDDASTIGGLAVALDGVEPSAIDLALAPELSANPRVAFKVFNRRPGFSARAQQAGNTNGVNGAPSPDVDVLDDPAKRNGLAS